MTQSLLVRMSEGLMVDPTRLDHLIASAPHRYKVYRVPKRSGHGYRVIAQPAREVKRIQRWLMKEILSHFPVHKTAMGYVAGRNIGNNAEIHAKNPYLLKLDFEHFFPSIKGDDFLQYLTEDAVGTFTDGDAQRMLRALFWQPKGETDLRLSIGAPSSPYLSNALMLSFDEAVHRFCLNTGVSYSRYADDMTFSMTDMTLRDLVMDHVRVVLADLPFPRLTLNHRKTIYGSKAHRRTVTGLVLTNDGCVSLGRKKKRKIRAKVHNMLTGTFSDRERDELQGYLAFARSVEPEFVRRLENKYGVHFGENV